MRQARQARQAGRVFWNFVDILLTFVVERALTRDGTCESVKTGIKL
jgi:hypothetical protein